MRAHVGDIVVVPGRNVGSAQRRGEILEVHGRDGAPPYLVRWETDNNEAVFFPTSAVQLHQPSADAGSATTKS